MEEQIQRAVSILKKGGIVAFPTDTVYGLGANAFDEDAVLKVYLAKNRPRNFALTLLLSDESQIKLVAQDIPKIAWKLIHKFMPGGLTLVFQKSLAVSNAITGEGSTIAVRIPDHPIPIALIRGLGAPITGTSANISGAPSPVSAEEVYQQLRRRVDMIIDGGRCPDRVSSTVLDMTTDPPTLLREGTVKVEDIARFCKCPIALSPSGNGSGDENHLVKPSPFQRRSRLQNIIGRLS